MDAGSLEVARADLEHCVEVAALSGTASTRRRPGTTSGTSSSSPAGSRGRWPSSRRPPRAGRPAPDLAARPGPGAARGGARPRAGGAADPGRRPLRGAPAGAGRRPRPSWSRAECALVEGDVRRRWRWRGGPSAPFGGGATRCGSARRSCSCCAASGRTVAEAGPARRPRGRRAGRRELRRLPPGAAPRPGAAPPTLLAVECRLRAGGHPDEVGPALPAVRAADPLQARLRRGRCGRSAALGGGQRARAAAEVRRGSTSSARGQPVRLARPAHRQRRARRRAGPDRARRGRARGQRRRAVRAHRAAAGRSPPGWPGSARPPTSAPPSCSASCGAARRRPRVLRGRPGGGGRGGPAARRGPGCSATSGPGRGSWRATASGRPPQRPGRARSARRRATAARRSSASSRHRGRWLAVVASGRRPRLVELAPTAEVVELVQRVRADLDALAMPQLPAPLVDAVRRSLDARAARGSTTCCLRRWASTGPRCCSCSGRAGAAAVEPAALPAGAAGGGHAERDRMAAGRVGPAQRPRVVAVAGPGLHAPEEEAAQVRGAVAGRRAADRRRAPPPGPGARRSRAPTWCTSRRTAPTSRRARCSRSLRLADGPLYAYELDAEGLRPCVVLSACEAGLATVRPGDEGLGLTSVLLAPRARARCSRGWRGWATTSRPA